MKAVAADFQPALQQIELGAFSGAVRTLDNDQGARIGTAGHRASRLRQGGFRRFCAGLLLYYVLVIHLALRAKRSASTAYLPFVTRVLQHTASAPAKQQVRLK